MVLQPVWEATPGDFESLFCSGVKFDFENLTVPLPSGTFLLLSHKPDVSLQSLKFRALDG